MRLLALPLVHPHTPTRLYQRSLCRRMRSLQAVPEAAYSGSMSQWVASPFKAASSPTSAERSRAVSLVTSFGSWGPTYAFLGLVAEASIHASYGHPTVLTDLVIASRAAMPRDGTHLSKSLERIVHRVVR